MNLTDARPIVYTAHSKHFFYCRDAVCEFVLAQDAVPLNPFRMFEYFLGDRVERDLVRRGNNNIVRIADQIWVFGPISDGVFFEIQYAYSLQKVIRYFSIDNRASGIHEVDPGEMPFEEEVSSSIGMTARQLRELVVSAAAVPRQLP